jgi:hypothetical protein
MNKFIKAITALDIGIVRVLLVSPQWRTWQEKTGKNALHYLCGIPVASDTQKGKASLTILKMLLKGGLDKNSIHKIPSGKNFFPATPLWYAYTRGRNERVYRYLLDRGADPEHCMFAITWNDEVKTARLFRMHGATLGEKERPYTPFLASVHWRRLKMMRWFLENGADPNFADPKGNTALYYAVKRKFDLDAIKLLLKFGADFNRENKSGVSPRMLAQEDRQRKVLKLFAP